MEPLDTQVRFLLESDRLKSVLRQSPLTDRSRRENSAEHSWHLTLMALILAEHAPPGTDLARVHAMLVVHDLVEIDAGDLFVYADPQAQRLQAERERAAADRIFGLLPATQADAARALWDEFEERRTPEARFARALDRLEPMLINMATGGGTWIEHSVTADQVLGKVSLIEDGSPALGAYAREMIARAVGLGFLHPAAGASPGQTGQAGRPGPAEPARYAAPPAPGSASPPARGSASPPAPQSPSPATPGAHPALEDGPGAPA